MTRRALVPALELLELDAWRIVTTPAVLDAVEAMTDLIRIAPDEAIVLSEDSPINLVSADPAAIVEADGGWSGAWMSEDSFTMLCAHTIDWTLPTHRPAVAQGLIAGVPAKVWLVETEADVLLMTPTAFAHDLIDRLG
jgi:hypothetical protein